MIKQQQSEGHGSVASSRRKAPSYSFLSCFCPASPKGRVLDIHFISDSQSLDQNLSTTLSAPVSRLISACQLLDRYPLSRLKSANAAAR